MLEDSRSRIAAQLGVSPDEIALVRNTSEANNLINNGLPLKPGDEVVLWDQNHPTNNVGVGCSRSTLRYRGQARIHADVAAKCVRTGRCIRRALTPRTRVLSITHVSNVSGIRLPAKQLCEMAPIAESYACGWSADVGRVQRKLAGPGL